MPVSSTTKSIPTPNSTVLVDVKERDDASSFPRVSTVSSVDGLSGCHHRRTKCSRATPSTCSEASWNSQSGLLSNPPGSVAVSMRNLITTPLHGKTKKWYSGKWFFSCISCSCISDKSVQVDKDKKKKYFSNQPTGIQLQPPPTTPTIDSCTHAQYCYSSQATRQVFNDMVDSKAPEHDSYHHRSSTDDHQKLNPIPKTIYSATKSIIETDEEKVVSGDRAVKSQNFGRFSSGKSSRDDGGEEAAFSFPVLLNPSNARDHQEVVLLKKKINTTGKAVSIGCHDQCQQDHDPPKESLEVLRPTEELVMVTLQNNNYCHLSPEANNSRWPALISTPVEYKGCNCQSFSFPISPQAMNTEDDLASDASSDLFEIESFSSHYHPPPISSAGPMYNNSSSRNSVDDACSISHDTSTTTRQISHSSRSADEINVISSSPLASTEWYGRIPSNN